jgi:hypothetical protein
MSSSVAENIVAKSGSFDSIIVDGSSIGHGQVITKRVELGDNVRVISSGEIKLPANALITTISMVVTTAFTRALQATTSQKVGTTDGGTEEVVALVSGAMSNTSAHALAVGRGNSTDTGVADVLDATYQMVLKKAFFPEATSLYMQVHSSQDMSEGAVGFIVEFITL